MNNANAVAVLPNAVLPSEIESNTPSSNNDTSSCSSSWHAYLILTLALTARGVVLKNSEHKGPLYVQKPFYPEGRELAHIYILHPPGGMVSGDRLQITSNQNEHSKVLITTPGAGRVYRARPDRALQHQIITLNVADHASMEWLPQETILYPDAQTHLDTKVELGKNAHFIGWEVTSFGLPASNQAFESGSVNQCFQLRQQGRLKLQERLVINNDNREVMTQLAGMNQQMINGFMVAGPFSALDDVEQASDRSTDHMRYDNVMQQAKHHCDVINKNSKHKVEKTMAGATMVGEFIVIRYLGACSEQAKNLFITCWQDIRPALLNRDACKPRIWAT